MSLGNDFIGGFQATRAIREKRLDRDQQSALEKARRDLELERDLKRGQLERDLQGERITADATKQANAQTFQAGEGEKDRGFRTGERRSTQEFQSSESKLERDARFLANERTLNQAAQQFTKRLDFDQQNMGLGAGLKAREMEIRNDQFTKRLDFDQQNMGLGAGLKAREMEIRNDPDGMSAQLNAERLKKLKRENADNETVTPGVTPGAAAAPRKALTAQDSAALAWAKANPNSPQAKQILERLGVK